MLKHFIIDISAADSIAGMCHEVMSVREGFSMIPKLSYIRVPPFLTLGWNLSSEGWLSRMAVSYVLSMGDDIGSSLIMTVTFAVPPRCSGPYAGIHVTSLPSISAA